MISLMYRSFGLEPPGDLSGFRLAFIWLAAALFVVVSLAITIVLNFFSLFFGVTITFLGRNGVKFSFLHLFRRIPVMGFAAPILFGYAIWHYIGVHGAAWTLVPPLLTPLVAVGLLFFFVAANNLVGAKAPDINRRK